jgi:GNAT superfamily N-acetyltransferase
MGSPHYTIRKMSRDEINIAVDWAASEGWNPGVYDADAFHAADPQGFLVGELNGEPIATISVVRYGETFGFLGFYIVKPAYRGRGYGIQIWNAGLKHLSGRNIGLDGVVSQQDNYKKSGFQLAYRNIRYEGISGGNASKDSQIVDLSQVSFDLIREYDQNLFPDDRKQFLQAWIHQPESISLGYMQNGKLAGYGMIRKCRTGYKIGPLFADNAEIAEALLGALQSRITPGSVFYLDVSEINQEASALAKKHQMKLVFETARMYTGEFPVLPLHKVFGITTFELG